jgi:periplasmic protein TonB
MRRNHGAMPAIAGETAEVHPADALDDCRRSRTKAAIMMTGQSENSDRIKAGILAAALMALTGYVLIAGLAVHIAADRSDDLKLFGIATVPPPIPVKKIIPRPKRSRKHEGAASPPNLRAKPTEIVAPPVIRPPVSPVIAAPTPGPGSDPSAGASAVKGPGSGSGGQGTGTGSGGEGEGAGDGGETPLRWIKGRIRDSDYPREVLKAGIGGTVYMRFVVGTKGRVTECSVTRSSGNIELDETTCRLIMQRFRYEPTRDAKGRAVPDVVTGEHVWIATEGEDSSGDPEP